MIKVGKGQGQSVKESLEEAAESVGNSQLLLFFCKQGLLDEAAEFFKSRFPDIPTIGLCTIGTLHDGRVGEPDVLLLSFEEDYNVVSGLINDLGECPVQHVYQLHKAVETIGSGTEDTVCIEFCTGNEEMLVTTLNAVLDRYGIPLVGISAFEGMENLGKTHFSYCGKIYQDACAYAVIRCRSGKVRTYYENIYTRTELTLHQVTKADVDRRSIIEIDGRPAAEVYSSILQVPIDEILSIGQRYPLGRVLGDRVFVAGISGVLPDGTLNSYKRINPNDAVCFMDYGRYREVAEETIQRIREENRNIYFTFTGECILRHALYNSEGFMEEHAKNMSLLGGHVGVFGGGEQFHHQHITQCMVMAVFSHDE